MSMRSSDLARLRDVVAAARRRYPFPFEPGKAPLEGLEMFRAEFSPQVCADLLEELDELQNRIEAIGPQGAWHGGTED